MPEPKLSIVVATYRMQREAPRTIASLLPPLQRCVDDLDYEIVVIDNGSPEPLCIGDAVATAARPVRLVRVAPEDASASPASCINRAVREHATGDWLMVCIDGARLASSHLVRRTADVLARHPDAFTFVGSRHLGPKRQMQSVKEGYDQAAEDRLLDTVDWTADLDELYAISVWAGAHDRKNPSCWQNESNAGRDGPGRCSWSMRSEEIARLPAVEPPSRDRCEHDDHEIEQEGRGLWGIRFAARPPGSAAAPSSRLNGLRFLRPVLLEVVARDRTVDRVAEADLDGT